MSKAPSYEIVPPLRMACARSTDEAVAKRWIDEASLQMASKPGATGDPEEWHSAIESMILQPLLLGDAYMLDAGAVKRLVKAGYSRTVPQAESDTTKLISSLLPSIRGFVVLEKNEETDDELIYDAISWCITAVDKETSVINIGHGVDLENDRWSLNLIHWRIDPDTLHVMPLWFSTWQRDKPLMELYNDYQSGLDSKDTGTVEMTKHMIGATYVFYLLLHLMKRGSFDQTAHVTRTYRKKNLPDGMSTDEMRIMNTVTVLSVSEKREWSTGDKVMFSTNDCSIALEQMYGLHHWLSSPVGIARLKQSNRSSGMTTAEYDRFIQTRLDGLRRSSPFYWSAEMCEFLEISANTMPNWTLTENLVSCSFGYMWFDKALYLPVADDEHGPDFAPDDVIAIQWQPFTTKGVINKDEREIGLVFAFYTRTPIRMTGTPAIFFQWQYGDHLEALYKQGIGEIGAKDPTQLRKDGIGLTERVLERTLLQLKYVAASFALLNQVIDVEPTRISRPAYRRLERSEYADIEPDVRVVALRRKRYAKNPLGGGSDVHWNYKWSVRGHWRNQYYAKTDTHRPIWVDPYIKGPSDAPFKKTTNLFAVVQ